MSVFEGFMSDLAVKKDSEINNLRTQRDKLLEACKALLQAQQAMAHPSDYLPGVKYRQLEFSKNQAQAAIEFAENQK